MMATCTRSFAPKTRCGCEMNVIPPRAARPAPVFALVLRKSRRVTAESLFIAPPSTWDFRLRMITPSRCHAKGATQRGQPRGARGFHGSNSRKPKRHGVRLVGLAIAILRLLAKGLRNSARFCAVDLRPKSLPFRLLTGAFLISGVAFLASSSDSNPSTAENLRPRPERQKKSCWVPPLTWLVQWQDRPASHTRPWTPGPHVSLRTRAANRPTPTALV